MFIVLVIYHISRKRFAAKDKELDILATTPKDFTIHVYGLGNDINKDEVKEFFENNGRFDGKKAQVIKVNFPYKIKKYIDINSRYDTINEDLQMIEYFKRENIPLSNSGCCKNTRDNSEDLKNELLEINLKRKEFESELPAGVGKDLLIGQAFITFQTQADARAVAMKYGRNLSYRFFYYILNTFCGCCINKNINQKFKTKHIVAHIAHEPSDIF